MAKPFRAFKKIFRSKPRRSTATRRPARRDPQFVGRSSAKDIEEASPERAGELAGHAVERVET